MKYTQKAKVKILDKQFEIAYPYSELQSTISEMANKINNDYKDKDITFIIVLKGAMPFAVDLMKSIDNNCRSRNYFCQKLWQRNGKLRYCENISENLDIKGKEVVILEDIVDTGRTLKALKEKLWEMNPKSIEIATLFSKPAQRVVEIDVKYIGIEIPPIFIVGYGLDYAEQGRQLPAVYQLSF